mgnify:CR=1 FL=1
MAPLLTWLAAQQFIQVINQFLGFIAVIIISVVFLIIHFVIFFFETASSPKSSKSIINQTTSKSSNHPRLRPWLSALALSRQARPLRLTAFAFFTLCRNRLFLVQINSIFIIQVIQFQIAVV